MTEKMLMRKDGAVGWMIFNNPERRNAVSASMWQAIPGILDALEADEAIRVIVLTGTGDKAFVAGADISEFEKNRNSADAAREYGIAADAAQLRMYRCTKPTIAMIRGYCIGGGLGVALNCDMRIAAKSAKFAVPAARLGLGYAAKHIKKLVDVVGTAQAKEIFYTARRYGAEEAYRIGLVNHLVEDGELEAKVAEICASIADNAPLTIHAAKEAIFEINRVDALPDLDRCDQLEKACFDSEDYAEGRRAFMEKRKPVFRGR
ncbi:MAG: enoyl-CoA hydratase/isomerase family protein [Salinarimonas sp.]|nr:enoyl-CoA hydratase/isomerase family protein [Salinarimonas sp.]